MSESTDAETKPKRPEIVAHRVTLADLDEMANWLMERLPKVYPGRTTRELLGWLRGCCESNEYFFVRTPLAVALVQVVHEPMVVPRAEERFVFAMEKGFEQAANLYHDIRRWCVTSELDEYVISRATDVEENRIATRMGKVTAVPLKFVAIPIHIPT